MRLSALALAACLLSSVSVQAMAQTVPSTIAPEKQKYRFEKIPTPSTSKPSVLDDVEPADVNEANDIVNFRVNRINFEGTTRYPESELQAELAGYIGDNVTMRDLRHMAERITAKYRRDGYVLSRAFVPPQRVSDGVVTFNVVEGYISEVKITGDINGKSDLIQRYADKIQHGGPLSLETLERYLLLADDLPGITARGVITPSNTEGGAATLNVIVDQDYWEGSLQLDNRGNRFLGPIQMTGIAAANNMFGIHDRTTVRGLISAFEPDELQYVDVTHEEQVGSEGTRVTVRAAYTGTEPGSYLEGFGFEGESQRLELRVEHPFVRSRTHNLRGRIGFDYVNAETDIATFELYDDQVRTLVIGAEIDFSDDWEGINLVDLEFRRGLNVLGATHTTGANRSRADGDATFTSLQFSASRVQQISGPWSVFGAAAGQYAFDPLLSSEEFTLGGAAFGSAYDAAEITGDHGLAGRLELRYGRHSEWKYIDTYQLYGFYDAGVVWENDAPIGVDDRDTLNSTGLGVRLNASHDLSAFAELALPIGREVAANRSNGEDARIFFGVVKRF